MIVVVLGDVNFHNTIVTIQLLPETKSKAVQVHVINKHMAMLKGPGH